MKKISIALIAVLFAFGWGCDKDKFADLNTDPSTLDEPDLRFSTTTAIKEMYSNDYTLWFYSNFQNVFPWVQLTSKSGGNDAKFNEMSAGDGHNIYSQLIPQTLDVRNRIAQKGEAERATFKALKAITYAIQIQPAITVTDNTGSMVYTEAGLAPYTNPPLLTPVLDTQKTLFDTWLKELDGAIADLENTTGQFQIGEQDVIYNGDYQKWAKFCNLLKLKIAARLVNIDRARALKIAEEVAKSNVGYMNDLTDDFIYHRGVKWYGNGPFWIGYAGRNLVDFMIGNRDPRVRFIFEKNDFNKEVVQTFIDNNVKLPPYVKDNVELDADGNFSAWKGAGEPWVRYYGAPLSPDEKQKGENDIYFNQGVLYRVTIGDAEKSYSGTSLYSEKIIRTSYAYTYPTKPGGRVIELKNNAPGLRVILGSAAETNLYLAEFKLLGANLPNTAQEYFNQGVTLSVKRMDALAKVNQMPYYNNDPVYTSATEAEAAGTKLRDGEIANLLTKDAYNLSTDGLEKVYIQQFINFANTPGDIWSLARRSGIPKKGSSYFAWEDMKVSDSEATIPRRFIVATPTKDDKNYANKQAAVEEQGFTTGTNDPIKLNAERLWFDKQNPAYGAGPKQ